jgi:hypothetical protein
MEENRGNCKTWNFIIFTFTIYQGYQMMEDEIGGVCRMYGKDRKCVENCSQITWREATTWTSQVYTEG